jgi:integrase
MPSIRQRPNGKWRARYRDDDGKEHSRHFERKRDGQAWLDDVASSRLTGTYVAPAASRVTLAAYYADWAPRQVWATGTRRNADQSIAACAFRDVPFGKLRRSHAEAWVKSMETHLAASTIQTRVRYVGGVLKAAVLDRVLALDPTVGLRLPQIRRREHTMRIPTPAEVQAVRDAAEPFLWPLLDVMAFAGLRIGEGAAVKTTDVRWLQHELHVARQIQNRPANVREVCAPKHGSERVVPVPPKLTLRLSAHIADVGVHADGWLLPGSPPSPNALRRWFEKACRAAGVEGITPHDYRHFYASGLIRAGLDAVSVSRAMGHASPSITLNVYAHLFPDAADRTRAAAADLLASTAAPADRLRTTGA